MQTFGITVSSWWTDLFIFNPNNLLALKSLVCVIVVSRTAQPLRKVMPLPCWPKDIWALVPQTMDILPYMAKGALQTWLKQVSWDRDIILRNLGEPSVFTRLLVRGRQEGRVRGRKLTAEVGVTAGRAQKPGTAGRPWKTRKAKHRATESNQLCGHLSSSPVQLALYLWPPEEEDTTSVLFKAPKSTVICHTPVGN